MDHAFDSPYLFERPPRRLTLLALVGGAAALAILILGVFYAAKAIAQHGRHHNARGGHAATVLRPNQIGPTSPAGTPKLSRHDTSVLILNGNGVEGAAGVASKGVKAAGYTVLDVGNARPNDYPQSVIMFRPGYRAEAMRFGRDLGVKIVGPLDGIRIGDIHGARLVLVVSS